MFFLWFHSGLLLLSKPPSQESVQHSYPGHAGNNFGDSLGLSPSADLLQTKQAFELINSGLSISFIAAATKQEPSSALTLGSFSSALFRMQHKMFGDSLGKVDRELSWLPKHLRPPLSWLPKHLRRAVGEILQAQNIWAGWPIFILVGNRLLLLHPYTFILSCVYLSNLSNLLARCLMVLGGQWCKNFRGLHRLHLLKCYVLADFWGLSSGHHLHSFQLFEPAKAAVCSHLCFSSIYSLLSVSSQGCVSHSFYYPFFFAEGIWSYTATADTFVIFGRVLPALWFGW